MKQIRKRLTYANVMSTIAVFLVVGGATAFAASELAKNSVGTKQLKGSAVTAGKIKKEAVTAAKIKSGAVSNSKLAGSAVTSDKLAGSAVTGDKLAAGAVVTDKLADNAVSGGKIGTGVVSADKLVAGERSEAFHAASVSTSPMLANPIAEPPTTVLTTVLPTPGAYVVTAQTELINSIGATRFTECSLSDDGTSIADMAAQYEPALIFPSGGVSMTGISDGGTLKLSCKSNGNNTFAFEAQINAIRTGKVTG